MRIIAAIAATLALAVGAASQGREPAQWTSFKGDGGITGRMPPGWRVAEHRLVPGLLNPREIVSLGTGPLPVGGGGNCGRYPAAAMAALRRDERLISIQASTRSDAIDHLPGWPDRLELPKPQPMSIASRATPGVVRRVFTQRLDVRFGDWYYWIFVVYAHRPSSVEVGQAQRIIDTIEVG